jgi:signal transduction histidine kinase
MCVIAGWAALVLPARWAVTVGTALASGFIAMLVVVNREPGWVTWTCGVVLTCGAFLFVRRQRELVTRLHAAQVQLAERTRTDERHRIAREMHDLVGHSLTVTLLHLGSARLALDDDPVAARASLDQAEQAARESLDDVRAAVALLRTGDTADPLPAPTATGIPDLVRAYRNAGVHVDLELHGDLSRLPPARSLAAYRIAQESLTNAARHGDGTPITVHVSISAGSARLIVRNKGAARAGGLGGTGLAAMRERAAAAGGTLNAGPDRGAWLVEAVLPV